MRKEKMITRTIYVTIYEVMAVNLDITEVETLDVAVPSADAISPKKLPEVIDRLLPPDYKFVMIEGEKVEEKLYGMTETDFLTYAHELPPR